MAVSAIETLGTEVNNSAQFLATTRFICWEPLQLNHCSLALVAHCLAWLGYTVLLKELEGVCCLPEPSMLPAALTKPFFFSPTTRHSCSIHGLLGLSESLA
jgi:hypothetical protein